MIRHDIAGVIIEKDGKILMHRRDYEPFKNKIDTVGGYVEKEENIKDAAIREAKEETGYIVNIKKKLCEFDYFDRKEKKMHIFTAEITGGKQKSSKEGKPVWINLSSIPKDKIAFSHTLKVLDIYLKKYPRILIVDEKDNIIGNKNRNSRIKKDIYRVSALWITNDKNEILLAKRSLTKKISPGIWGPAAAGTIELGETYDSNIIKEAKEEIGLIDINPIKDKKILYKNQTNYFCQWYKLRINKNINDFKIDKNEVIDIRLVNHKELKDEIDKSPDKFLASLKKYYLLNKKS